MNNLYLLILCFLPLIFGKKIASDSVEDIFENNEQVLEELKQNISNFGDRLQRFVDLDTLPTNFSEHEDVINQLNLTNIFTTEAATVKTTTKNEPKTSKIELTTKKIMPTTIKITTEKIESSTKGFIKNVYDNVNNKIHNWFDSVTTEKVTTTTKKVEVTTKRPISESKIKIALWRIFIILFGLTVAPMCIAVLIFIVIKIKEFIYERSYFVTETPL